MYIKFKQKERSEVLILNEDMNQDVKQKRSLCFPLRNDVMTNIKSLNMLCFSSPTTC